MREEEGEGDNRSTQIERRVSEGEREPKAKLLLLSFNQSNKSPHFIPLSTTMPASSSDGRGKWKRRQRDPHLSRKPAKLRDDDDDDEDNGVPDDVTNNNTDNNNGNSNNNNNNYNQEDSEDQPQASAPNPIDTEIIPLGGIRLCHFPSVIQRSVSRPHASVLAVVAIERGNSRGESNRGQVLNLENLSYGQLQAVSAVLRDRIESDGGSSSGGGGCVLMPPAIMEGKGVVKCFGNSFLLLPLHSDWFLPATVHRLERQAVPHFFSGKSPDHTPEKYMECRNYIVSKYMENPESRLSVADCQELVAGIDNEDLTRIVRFLDHWGIINYCAAAPSQESWNSQSYLREDPSGEIHVPSTALKSIDSLIKFDRPLCRLKSVDVYSSFSDHDDDSSDLEIKIREHFTENYCNYCSKPLPIMYYQSQKEADVTQCLNCFHEGRFVTGHSSLDFVKLDATNDCGALNGDSWSDQETFLLLEAVEIYNENWNEIAEHVGTKSKAQCILHFLRLPMEDSLLGTVNVPCATKPSNALVKDTDGRAHTSSNGSCIQEADSENRLPFSNSGNPVMALVTFLASAVGPRVAAACAHASLAALSEDSRMNSESSLGSDRNIHGDTSNSNQQKEDRMQNTWGLNETSVVPLSAEKVKEAAKVGLAAAATKAKLFADHEEREIQRLSANIINHQLKRLELKLKQFAEVETFLMRECEQVEKARQRFAAERNRILSSRVGTAGSTSRMNVSGISSSMVNNNMSNNRPQVIPPSSQQSITGYGNTQQVHPHVSFMQRSQGQMMFPLGPRLPLTAIQPSSSSSQPNVMFNASATGNSQPAIMRQLSGQGNGIG